MLHFLWLMETISITLRQKKSILQISKYQLSCSKVKPRLIHHWRWKLSVLVVCLINMPKPSTCRKTLAPSAQWQSVQPDSNTDLLCTAPLGYTNSPSGKATLLPFLTFTTVPASVACRHWWHKHINFTWQWVMLSAWVHAKKSLICSRNYKPCSYLHWNPCRNSPPPLPSLLACSNSKQT